MTSRLRLHCEHLTEHKWFRMVRVCLRGWERSATKEGFYFFLIFLSSMVIIVCNRT